MEIDHGWESFGPPVRRECPLCAWHLDEPPMETTAEWVGDAMVMRVRQHSAVPAGLAHILREHPDSDQAWAIRRALAQSEAANATPCALHGNLPPCIRCLVLVTGA